MAGVLLIKQIKPRRLKEDALRLELLNEMRAVLSQVIKDFRATTATWEHKVEFERSISLALGGPSISVVTTDEIYNYVNNGTKPHPIFAGIYTGRSNKKSLAFPSGYHAKTKPRVIGSQAGGGYGRTVFAPEVMHPGTEGRHFDEEIAKKWEKRFKRDMEKAMARAARASGHGV